MHFHTRTPAGPSPRHRTAYAFHFIKQQYRPGQGDPREKAEAVGEGLGEGAAGGPVVAKPGCLGRRWQAQKPLPGDWPGRYSGGREDVP